MLASGPTRRRGQRRERTVPHHGRVGPACPVCMRLFWSAPWRSALPEHGPVVDRPRQRRPRLAEHVFRPVRADVTGRRCRTYRLLDVAVALGVEPAEGPPFVRDRAERLSRPCRSRAHSSSARAFAA